MGIVRADMETRNIDKLLLDVFLGKDRKGTIEIPGEIKDILVDISGKVAEAIGGIVIKKPAMRQLSKTILESSLPVELKVELYNALLMDVFRGTDPKAKLKEETSGTEKKNRGRPRTKPRAEDQRAEIEAMVPKYETALREIINESAIELNAKKIRETKDIPKKIAAKLRFGVFLKIAGSDEAAEVLMDNEIARKAAVIAICKVFPNYNEGCAQSFYAYVTKNFRDKGDWKAALAA